MSMAVGFRVVCQVPMYPSFMVIVLSMLVSWFLFLFPGDWLLIGWNMRSVDISSRHNSCFDFKP